MITKASKCSMDDLQRVANFVCENPDFSKENFPSCSNPDEVSKALASSRSWQVLVINQPAALLKLEVNQPFAAIPEILVSDRDQIEVAFSTLRRDLCNMKVTSFTVRVSPDYVQLVGRIGFATREAYVRFSRVPTESKMMPILPLTNVTQKELPILSRLMYDAYARTNHSFPNNESTIRSLRTIMSGAQGRYLPDASFASGALPNLVSACLLTVDSPGIGSITQLFTHPLYRARGLATTEITAAMNRLVASGIGSLTMWSREGNDILMRLLTKLDFGQDRRVVEMSAQF
jgi:ribosomal protein S18 acetylase RimI-like enzyme